MLVFLLALSLLIHHLSPPLPDQVPPQRLRVQVAGMESPQGTVQVAIFDSPRKFLETPCRQGVIRSLTADTVQIDFELPPGEYAVAVYQDTNRNQQLDKNFFGIPREAYGFSNHVRGSSLGPPSFEDAKIVLGQQPHTICISLH